MEKKPIYAFYGSLRPGEYNYHRLRLAENSIHLGIHKIPGFKMFSLGGYPYIMKATDDDVIVVDLMEITSPTIEGYIDRMEIGAGYERTIVNIAGHDAVIYTMKRTWAGAPHVQSGDWVQFLQEQNKTKATV
jgi:gamma-glutamylcyclotransferase (GGCT)/AIG2-like uncharacterized protein YtfP